MLHRLSVLELMVGVVFQGSGKAKWVSVGSSASQASRLALPVLEDIGASNRAED